MGNGDTLPRASRKASGGGTHGRVSLGHTSPARAGRALASASPHEAECALRLPADCWRPRPCPENPRGLRLLSGRVENACFPCALGNCPGLRPRRPQNLPRRCHLLWSGRGRRTGAARGPSKRGSLFLLLHFIGILFNTAPCGSRRLHWTARAWAPRKPSVGPASALVPSSVLTVPCPQALVLHPTQL